MDNNSKEEAEVIKRIVNMTRERNSLLDEAIRKNERMIKLDADRSKLIKEMFDLEDKIKKLKEIEHEMDKAGLKNVELFDAELQKILGQESKIKELREKGVDYAKEMLRTAREELQTKKEADKLLAKHEDITESIIRKSRKSAAELLQTFTGITDRSDSFFGRITSAKEEGIKLTDSLKVGILEFGRGVRDMLTYTNVFGSIISKIKESTIAWVVSLNEAYADFQRQTGLIDEYRGAIGKLGTQMLDMGITTGDVSRNIVTLLNDLKNFSLMSKSSKEDLTQFVSVLERVGINSNDSVGALNFLINSLQQTRTEGKKTIREMIGVANSLGMMPGEILKEFTQLGPKLIKYGDDMKKVFTEMAKSAKNVGISTQEFFEIADKYDTFESAASTVGRINAILGGPYLNAVQMLRANEEERVELLVRQFQATGKNFKNLNRFEKQALASAAGIEDMAVATNLFTTTWEKYNQQRNEEIKSEKELQELAKKSAGFREKLTKLTHKFAIMLEPLIDKLNGLLDWINSTADSMGDYFIPTIFALGSAVVFLNKIIGKSIANALVPFAEAAGKVVGVLAKGLAGAVMTLGKAFLVAAPGLISFGAAALMVGAAVGVAAAGIGYMWDAFSDDDEEIEKLTLMESLLKKIEETGAEDKIDKLAQSFLKLGDSISKIGFQGAVGFTAIISQLDEFAKKIQTSRFAISAETTIRMLSGFEEMLLQVNRITPQSVQNTKEIIKEAIQYSNSVVNNANNTKIINNDSKQQPIHQTIIVKIGEKELQKVVSKVIDRDMGLRRTLG